MLRRLLLSLAVGVLLAGAYAVWPLMSAFTIKQAVRRGDVETLERKVAWAPVRASLKASIAALPPRPLIGGDQPLSNQDEPHRSLWNRFMATVQPMLADRIIDTYVSARGITKLDQTRHSRFMAILGFPQHSAPGASGAGTTPETTTAPGAVQRFLNFYGKIVHARFQSLSQVEFEIADRPGASRHLITLFELSGFEWKLASMRVVAAGL